MKNTRTIRIRKSLFITLLLMASFALSGCQNSEETKVVFKFGDSSGNGRNVDKCVKPTADGVKNCVIIVDAETDNPRCWLNYMAINGTVTYNKNGRNDSVSNSARKNGGPGTRKLEVPLEMAEIGGSAAFTASVQAACEGGWSQVFTENATKTLGGVNPTNKQVRDRLIDTDLQVAIYQITKFDMFESGGMPLYTNGFGIGRLEQPVYHEIWNWAKNTDATIAKHTKIKTESAKYPKTIRDAGGTVPDFSTTQLKAEVYQQWVGEHYWVPNANRTDWIKNSSASNFGDKAMQLESEVSAGNLPADW